MIFQVALNAARPVSRVEPTELRRESPPRDVAFARLPSSALSADSGDRAAVFHFGSQALDLARQEIDEEARQNVHDAFEQEADSPLPEEPGADVDEPNRQTTEGNDPASDDDRGDESSRGERDSRDDGEPSREEQRQINEMRRRDREVRTHEQAHKSAGGEHTGSIHLQYQVGPDGKRYAVEGSVPIDVSPVGGDAEATLRKMQVVRRAATAPANPSGADRRAAAHANRVAQRARAQIAAERYEKAQEVIAEQQKSTNEADAEPASPMTPPEGPPGVDAPDARFSHGLGRGLQNHVLQRESAGFGRYQAPVSQTSHTSLRNGGGAGPRASLGLVA